METYIKEDEECKHGMPFWLGCDKCKRARNKNKDSFYKSEEWKELRIKVFNKYGRVCMKCDLKEGAIHVDHIEPKSLYPEKKYDFNNLQVLCEACNLQKSNKEIVDYRCLHLKK